MNGHGQSWVKAASPMAVFRPGEAGEKISFAPVVSTADEPGDPDYPFTAIFGSLRYHLGSGTRTSASGRIRDFELGGNIAIGSADAAKLKLEDGDTVSVESPWGVIKRKIRGSARIGPGQVFIPLAFNANDAMNLIDFSDLADPKSAGWKTCAVKIRKA
jgi:anaerobic selenocysteine-containing dehydrogenase